MAYIWDTTPAEDLGQVNAAITYVLAHTMPALAEVVDAGPKNLLANSASTTTTAKVTFTVNADKSITITSAGDNTQASIAIASNYSLPAGKYIVSGSEGTGTTGDTYAMWVKIGSAGSISVGEQGRIIELDETATINVTIIVRAAQTVADVTFKPMICTIPDWNISRKYVPYQPSYAELVARVEALENPETKTATQKKAATATDEGKEG